MKSFTKLFFNKIRLIYSIILFFVVFVGLYQSYNSKLKITNDPAYYAMGAINLHEGNGFYSYNTGFLAKDKFDDKFDIQPITIYQPGYSVAVSFMMYFTNDMATAMKVTNILFWFLCVFLWFNVFRLIFKDNIFYFILATIPLVFSSGMWTYATYAVSEPVFVALLALAANLIYFYSNSNTNKQLIYIFLLSLTMSAIALTRYAGLAFVLGTGIFLLFQIKKSNQKTGILHVAVFCATVFVSLGLWVYRNYSLTQQATMNPISKDSDTIFDFPRIKQLLNYYFSDSLGLPTTIESFGFLLLFLFAGIIIWFIANKKKYSANPFFNNVNTWGLLILVPYIGMIVYLGIFNHKFNRYIGFARYFYLTQPILILFLLSVIQFFKDSNIKSKLKLPVKIIFGGILAITILSSANRTRVFFSTLYPETKDKALYLAIKENVSKEDLLMSNHWQTITLKSQLACRFAQDADDVNEFINKTKTPVNQYYLVLFKDIGHSYRIGAPIWEEEIPKLSTEIIYETDEHIFVKILK